MRIGFLTGSIVRIGSGRTVAVPLARAFSRLGCDVYGLETTRLMRGRTTVDSLEVHFEPVVPYLAPHVLQVIKRHPHPHPINGRKAHQSGLRPLDLATGDALVSLGDRLDVDVVYAFHNTNVARILPAWPNPACLLAINLIGFGIDPSRGGSTDTFPLQKLIFERPYWDLHITATKSEFDQYCHVYEQLGLDSKKLMHLPHSFDERLFRPQEPVSHGIGTGSDRRAKTILYPVNVYPRKNIELAIDVMAIAKQTVDCRLVVTGSIWDPAYQARLREHAQRRGVGDCVDFLGGVTTERLVELYNEADVTVYTSHQETFGFGLVESLGCGTPVVGPDWIIPCREILSDTPGGWTAPKDPHAFAAAILKAFNEHPRPADVAASARDRYGNMAIAARFLERCREIKSEKDNNGMTLASINWKGLYQDAGDLI